MILRTHINPQRQAHIYASGLLALLSLGTFALIAVCIAAFWLLIQFALLALQSIVECSHAIGTTFQSADPLVKFLMLLACGFVVYRVARRFNWRI